MSRPLSLVLDQANPNNLPDALRTVPVGKALGLLPRSARVPVAANVAVLPEGARAVVLLSVFVTAGTATGQFTPLNPNATPATTEAAINAVGNVAFFADDVVTEAEITYLSVEGEIFEDTINVASNVGTLPSGRKALVLLEAYNVTSGSSALTVLARGGSNPSSGNARISLTGATMLFHAAVTKARVRYVAAPVKSVDASLRSNVDF